jgi:hypothetical protein
MWHQVRTSFPEDTVAMVSRQTVSTLDEGANSGKLNDSAVVGHTRYARTTAPIRWGAAATRISNARAQT